MKYYFLLIFLSVTLATQAQKILETPPGTIKINDSLYIDKGPVDNKMYLEFIDSVNALWNYTLQDSLKSLNLEEIDDSLLTRSLNPLQSEKIYEKITLVEDLKISDKVDIEYYFRHPKYQHHPMVGVSKEQAQLFCEWRTDMVNLKWGKEITNNKTKYHKIKYRLPTKKEYRMAKRSFIESDKILLPNTTLLKKIDMEILQRKDIFILYHIPEFTSTEKYLDSLEKATKTKNNFTFFRCICEVQ